MSERLLTLGEFTRVTMHQIEQALVAGRGSPVGVLLMVHVPALDEPGVFEFQTSSNLNTDQLQGMLRQFAEILALQSVPTGKPS